MASKSLAYPCQGTILKHFPLSLRMKLASRVRELRVADRKEPYKFDEIVVEHFSRRCRIQLKSFDGSASIEIEEHQEGAVVRMEFRSVRCFELATELSVKEVEKRMLDFFLDRPGTVTKYLRVCHEGSETVLGYPIRVTRELRCERIAHFEAAFENIQTPVLCLDIDLKPDKIDLLIEMIQSNRKEVNTKVEVTVLESVFGGQIARVSETIPLAKRAITRRGKPCVVVPMADADVVFTCASRNRQDWPWRSTCKSGITSYQLRVVAKGSTAIVEDAAGWRRCLQKFLDE